MDLPASTSQMITETQEGTQDLPMIGTRTGAHFTDDNRDSGRDPGLARDQYQDWGPQWDRCRGRGAGAVLGQEQEVG